jgi:hypothetical protein
MNSNRANAVIVGVLFIIGTVSGTIAASIGSPILDPIMKKYSAGLAIGMVGFRVSESVLEILGGVATIALLALSQEFVKAGAPDAASFQAIGAIIKAGDEWMSNGVTPISWCIGAFMYYSLFYQYRLVPRWLSGWGLVGITLTTIASVLVMLHVVPGFGTVQIVSNLPIALQEMVFAVWLIAKGVNLSAVPKAA